MAGKRKRQGQGQGSLVMNPNQNTRPCIMMPVVVDEIVVAPSPQRHKHSSFPNYDDGVHPLILPDYPM
jgi:hypothetical protein